MRLQTDSGVQASEVQARKRQHTVTDEWTRSLDSPTESLHIHPVSLHTNSFALRNSFGHTLPPSLEYTCHQASASMFR